MAATKDREAKILRELEQLGSVSVKKLSAELQCSEVTIRNDIMQLEQKGYLKRIHGGAVLKQDGLSISFPIGEYLTHREEKIRIAAFAYKYINNRDSIILDDSTTGYYLAKVIKCNPEKRIIVVTNSLLSAAELSSANHVELFMVSGHVVGAPPSILDNFAIESLQQFNVSKAFIGVNGINLRKGLASLGAIQRDVKKAIISASQELYVLADHTKFEGSCLFSVCDMEAVTKIITDDGVTQDIRDLAKELGTPIDFA
jgi:DeoR/GlpR family transcriptional regulator of sugar metabolism